MCGRFTVALAPDALRELLGVDALPPWTPRYNVAPTQEVLMAHAEPSGRRVVLASWGLKKTVAGEGTKLVINARQETLFEKPSFRDAARRRRCLIPASGFYEWKRQGAKKQPLHFALREVQAFALAGLFEIDGSCAVITTAPNPMVARIHDRMPAILVREQFDRWLDPKTSPLELRELLGPISESRMTMVEVSERTNDVKNDDPSCLAPPTPVSQLGFTFDDE